MKRISIVAIAMILSIFPSVFAKESSPAKKCGDHGLLFSISVPDGTHKISGNIPLTFSITNTGTNSAMLHCGFDKASFDKDTQAYAVSSGTYILCQKQGGGYLKFKGCKFKADGIGRILKAGEELKAYSIDLAKCFDLVPGTYDVQLVFSKRYSGFIDGASNRITITVE